MDEEKGKFELMVFWHYDLFPYMLWGNIDEIDELGRLRVRKYSMILSNYLFILPACMGIKLAKHLEALKGSYTESISAVKVTHKRKLDDLLNTYNVSR